MNCDYESSCFNFFLLFMPELFLIIFDVSVFLQVPFWLFLNRYEKEVSVKGREGGLLVWVRYGCICVITCQTYYNFSVFFFSIQFYVPFKIFFNSYKTGQSVGWRKRDNLEKSHKAHP